MVKNKNSILVTLGTIAMLFLFGIAQVMGAIETPITTDSRIKTFIYNPNEIFRIVVHYNYQTSIEFAKGEEIKTISSGNNYAWQLIPVDNRLFIKPMEDNILTNMTVITNEWVYQFEVQSKPYSDYVDNELVYVVRFFLPTDNEKTSKPQIVEKAKSDGGKLDIKPYNFNYHMDGAVKFFPTKVFDDGIKTYIYYNKSIRLEKPDIKLVKGDGDVLKIRPKIVGDYLVIDNIGQMLELSFDNNVVEITNKNFTNNK